MRQGLARESRRKNARRSRTATGAVVWFNPTTTIAMRVRSIAPRGTHEVCTKYDARTTINPPTVARAALGALPA